MQLALTREQTDLNLREPPDPGQGQSPDPDEKYNSDAETVSTTG